MKAKYKVVARVVYPYRTPTGFGAQILKRTITVEAYTEDHARRLAEKELQSDEMIMKYTILEVQEVERWLGD